jgi:hypothetical protein
LAPSGYAGSNPAPSTILLSENINFGKYRAGWLMDDQDIEKFVIRREIRLLREIEENLTAPLKARVAALEQKVQALEMKLKNNLIS